MRFIGAEASLKIKALAASWRQSEGWALPVPAGKSAIFVDSGTSALVLAVQLAARPVLLLPDFYCPTLTMRLQGLGADCLFYPVSEQLEPDWSWIASCRPGAPKTLVLYHYYGVLQAVPPGIVEHQELKIVEDAAHALWTEGVGRSGAAIAYSFRKMLPVPDGGVLIVDDSWPAAPALPGAGFMPYMRAAYLAASVVERRWFPSFRGWLLRRGELVRAWETTGCAGGEIRAMSSMSRRLTGGVSASLVAAARRAHYARYERLLPADSDCIRRLFPPLAPGTVPFAFPILVKKRDAVIARLLDSGVRARAIWSWLIAGGPAAQRLSEQILLLPVHEELRSDEVDWAAQAVDHAVRHCHGVT